MRKGKIEMSTRTHPSSRAMSVHSELNSFDDRLRKLGSTASMNDDTPTHSTSLSPFQPTRDTSEPHNSRSLARAILRLQEAVRWLMLCPPMTLYTLQRRALVRIKKYVYIFAGVPNELKPYITIVDTVLSRCKGSDHAKQSSSVSYDTVQDEIGTGGDDEGDDVDEGAMSLQPLSFTKFLRWFIRAPNNTRHATDAINDTNTSAVLVHTTVSTNEHGQRVRVDTHVCDVLESGRPRPVATLSAANLVYGPQCLDEGLRYTTRTVLGADSQPSLNMPVEATHANWDQSNTYTSSASNFIRRNDKDATDSGDAMTKFSLDEVSVFQYAETNQAFFAEVMQWNEFFFTFFDEASDGLCQEPVGLMCSILLAGAECGRVAMLRPNALTELDYPSSDNACSVEDNTMSETKRPLICSVCAKRTMSSAKLTAAYDPHRSAKQITKQTKETGRYLCKKHTARPMLVTPLAVVWIESFLQLYRLTNEVNNGTDMRIARSEWSSQGADDTGTCGDTISMDSVFHVHSNDVLKRGEAYVLRDWLAHQITIDSRVNIVCADKRSTLIVPATCASKSPGKVLGCTVPRMRAGLKMITAYIDDAVRNNTAIYVRVMLKILSSCFHVTASYLRCFLPRVLPWKNISSSATEKGGFV